MPRTIKELTCKRCKGKWFPAFKHKPKRCPKCRTPLWDTPRRYKWPDELKAKSRA